MNKHVMSCVELDDGGSMVCRGCRQWVHGSLTETPPGECPTPYKSPEQLLAESVAREAALRVQLHDAATSLETISKQAGRDEYMKHMSQVCGYAASRAKVAREFMDKPTELGASSPDPFTTCLRCFGTGTISTGIAEASSTICNACDGTGREQP